MPSTTCSEYQNKTMRAILAAVHGIMTKQTTVSWPDKLASWMWKREPGVLVIKKEYRAGPFPKINCLLKDPVIARGLAAEIINACEERPGCPVWIVAHSNGAVIALKTAKLLIAKGYQINGLILTGAACEADVKKNGIARWINDESLFHAHAFCSADDSVLGLVGSWWARLIAWPYGNLGRVGWRNYFVSDDIKTEWFAGGHSCYFSPDNINRTFEKIHRIINAK